MPTFLASSGSSVVRTALKASSASTGLNSFSNFDMLGMWWSEFGNVGRVSGWTVFSFHLYQNSRSGDRAHLFSWFKRIQQTEKLADQKAANISPNHSTHPSTIERQQVRGIYRFHGSQWWVLSRAFASFVASCLDRDLARDPDTTTRDSGTPPTPAGFATVVSGVEGSWLRI